MLDPLSRNTQAVKILSRTNKVETRSIGIDQLLAFPPYFGWVKMGKYNSYMLLNGKDDGVALRWLWNNTFETTSIAIWQLLSSKFSSIIDVGSHTGCYSLISALTNKKSSIIAIEPSPMNLSRLSMNLNYNMAQNVSVKNGAAYSSNVELFIKEDASYNYCRSGGKVSSQNIGNDNKSSKLLPVEGFTLDSLKSKNLGKSLIKIDTEGSEHHVLEGASYFIESRSWFLIESTSAEAAKTCEILLENQKYSFFLIDESTSKLINVPNILPIINDGKLNSNKLNRLLIPCEDVNTLREFLS